MRHFLNTGQSYVKAGTCDNSSWRVMHSACLCSAHVCFLFFFKSRIWKLQWFWNMERGCMQLPWLLGNTDVLQMCVVAPMFGFYFYHWLFYRQRVFGESTYLILKPVAEHSQLLSWVQQSQWQTYSGKAIIPFWEGTWTFYFIHFAFSLDEPCLKIRICTSLQSFPLTSEKKREAGFQIKY